MGFDSSVLNWKPVKGDKFYYMGFDHNHKPEVRTGYWLETIEQLAMYYAGLCFQFQHEAMAMGPAFLEKVYYYYDIGF